MARQYRERIVAAARAVLLAAAVAALIFPSPLAGTAAAQEPGAQDPERIVFNMLAQHVGTGAAGQTPVTITITRLSSMDERDALEEVFLDQGMQALAQALRDAPEVGFIRAPSISATGWRLRYAMAFSDGEGGRIFRLATDRPISFVEAIERPMVTWDFNVSLIELVVDAEGNGSGVLLAGVEFSYDQTNDAFGIKQISSQPTRLVNVTTQIQ